MANEDTSSRPTNTTPELWTEKKKSAGWIVPGFGDLSYLLNQTNSRVCLWNTDRDIFVDGVTSYDQFMIEGRSTWEAGDNSKELKDLGSTVETAAGVFNRLTGIAYTQRKVRDPINTTLDWMSSSRFSINVQIKLLAVTPEDDVSEKLGLILQGVYPKVSGNGFYVLPPLGYKKTVAFSAASLISSAYDTFRNSDSTWGMLGSMRDSFSGFYGEGGNFEASGARSIPGCWGISIGDWFETDQLFVMNSINSMVSAEETVYGKPLSADCVISLESATIVGYDDVKRWLKIET